MLEPDRVAYPFTLPHELPEVEFKGPGRICTCCFVNTRSLYFFFRSIQALNQLTTSRGDIPSPVVSDTEAQRDHLQFSRNPHNYPLLKVVAGQVYNHVDLDMVVQGSKSPKLIRRAFLLQVKFFCKSMVS